MRRDDEFAEFDTTEDEIDRMMAEGEPAEVDVPDAPRGFNGWREWDCEEDRLYDHL